ncbi:2,3,4,5-tetrahydropyridine-2,6-dicarboxylate N-succinyltransferase [invertebrate metagenome]|uniref:2,3,4,5-tetrahydropyridine-2,6-dicarboxylate N-succinyltransferase n=1 Tax=invertebrate metagenome TaxID=1711999 RepID=A0A484HCI5_9ZZZZ
MNAERLQALIDAAWEVREQISPATTGDVRTAVEEALESLDSGTLRVAERRGNTWMVQQWLKKAVLLSFRLNDSVPLPGGPRDPTQGEYSWYDKVAPKFAGWSAAHFQTAGIRALPGSFVRWSAYIAPGVILMPCFINMGARVENNSMVDTWATVGSCAQIGRNVHISGGVGIGGVLEPVQAAPVIIEDDCFIGARAEVAEGVIVERGAVLSMGVYIGASTRIFDRESGTIHYGRVPAWSVVVPGTLPGKPLPDGNTGGPSLYCAVIVKRVDEKTRARVSINELLRT